MSEESLTRNETSGKVVVIVFVAMCAIFFSALVFGYYTKLGAAKEQKMVKAIIDEQYTIAQKDVNQCLENKEYIKAIGIWQKFLKKFSHLNHYEDIVQKEIERLKKEVKENDLKK